jgi:transketolase
MIQQIQIPSVGSEIDRLSANAIRALSIDGVQAANSGHPGLPLGMADAAYVLWTRFLKHNPADPHWPDRDRFILSAGHGSMLIYSLLHLSGYDLPLDELKRFRQWGSRTPGHPEYHDTPGVETTTGPLGQGVGNGVGMAIAERYLATMFNRPDFPLVNHYTYVLCSDGDLMEGISHETASLAGHLKLAKLIMIYDANQISLDGPLDLSFSEDIARRFESYGWQVLHADGHSMPEVAKALAAARADQERPSIIITRTHIGYGSPNKQDSKDAHGAPLGVEEVKLTKQNLGWPVEPLFHVPTEVYANFKERGACYAESQQMWQDMLQRYRTTYPEQAAQWDQMMTKDLPVDWSVLPEFAPDARGIASRAASGQTINALAPVVPGLLGGSADLHSSNNTLIKGAAPLSGTDFSGRNLYFGVREHAMSAALNGMALHGGLIPYGGTFLVFSDYMRPAIRLAAIMGLHVIYVFTHDSIGLGEDGPTHQPIEHLAALRAIPNLAVLRPGDAAETAQAWRVALERRDGPTALVLSRQNLPTFQRGPGAMAPAEGVLRGAYVLHNPADPQVALLATGSELALAVKAAELLAERGIAARVVSMPSWELFEQQDAEYRADVLPAHISARVAIEAAAPFGWDRYVGPGGKVIAMTRFGASAPAGELFKQFGFTAENVATVATDLLG